MLNLSLKSRVVAILSLTTAAAACRASVTFMDGGFAPGTWNWEIDGTWGTVQSIEYTTARYAAGGAGGADGGAYLDTQSIVNASPTGGFNAFNWMNGAVYDPSKGALESIDFSFDVLFEESSLGTYGALMRLCLRQAGNYYVDYTTPGIQGGPGVGWQLQQQQQGYTALDIGGNSGLGHPDFSTSGAPITFGFVTGTGAYGYEMGHVAIDDWSVTVNTASVPEPFTMAVGVAALGLAVRRRRG